jgi:hypothetical protein
MKKKSIFLYTVTIYKEALRASILSNHGQYHEKWIELYFIKKKKICSFNVHMRLSYPTIIKNIIFLKERLI